MKKFLSITIVAMLALSLMACGNKQQKTDEELCPGKQPGVAGKPPVMAEGFDTTVDMSFTTTDTKGNTVTNDIFSGTDKGVWIVFRQTDNDKTAAELEKLNGMLDTAEKSGYKVVGVVMDGKDQPDKAKEMTEDLGFTNIVWNDEVAKRYEGVDAFFTEAFHKENAENFAMLENPPKAGDPVSVRANSRGQLQSSCVLVPMSEAKIEDMWKNNSNATYEELKEQEKAIIQGEK